jgi:hypothetical protein
MMKDAVGTNGTAGRERTGSLARHRSHSATAIMSMKGLEMGRVYEAIDAPLQRWLGSQPMFFVATAPTSADGHINLSPKGISGTFRILGPTTVAYLDLVGSGTETVAHLRENGRIVLMFCAFSGPPKIVRLQGEGHLMAPEDPEFPALLTEFRCTEDMRSQVRGIVIVEARDISDSCGFGVPRMDLVGERDQFVRWSDQQFAKHGPTWKERYMAANNMVSIDGLPGYDVH